MKRRKHRKDQQRKVTKPPGYEYWSARPGSNRGGAVPGRISKTITHRRERRAGKVES